MNSVSSSLQFKIDWLDSIDGVECQTLASIGLIVDGAPVWPVRGEIVEDFELFADELLAHLAECWKPLILRQSYPIPIQPERPSFLAAEAAKRWSQMPDAAVDSEQLELSNFEDIHNLTNAFGGITGLSPLWFLRDQDSMVVDTQELYFEIPIGEAIRSLEAAGNQIAERLRKGDDQKWARLLTAWHRRNEGDRTRLLALTIGRDQATAAALVADNIIEPPSSFADAANDNDELRIAARMAGPMPLLQIKSVIKIVGACKLRNAPRLKEMSDAAMQFLYSHELTNARPHNQGNEVALWLRRSLSLSPDRSVDPIRILEYQFNVDVRAIDFGISSLDAIAVWGPKHGPSVLINLTSKRIRKPVNVWRNGALRVTAAHELCHLLLDSKHALSAVDVLGGRMPIRIEQRAKAFAAEFLLPSKEAGEVWQNEGCPLDSESLRNLVKLLCRRHGVTESVAAWQLQHGASGSNWEELDRALDQLVPQR